jgi:ABC-2 type transport system ATP-binding protein
MISVENLQKVIDGNTVLDIPKLKVEQGKISALVGPTNSGKRAILDLLIGQSRPTAGTIALHQINPTESRDQLSRLIGVMFFEDGHYENRSPKANLAFHRRLRGLDSSRVEQVLLMVGLGDHAEAKMSQISSGLSRRLAFGRAILHEPFVLLLFEPFARCDEDSITLISKRIQEQAEAGVTILIFAEDVTHLKDLCHTIHMLNKGRIMETITPAGSKPDSFPFKIPVRLEGRVALVNPVDILYAETEGGKANLFTVEEKLETQFTLSELESRLARSGFFRAHRSYLVNLQHVTEVIPFTRNSYSIRLDDEDGTLIPLSKGAASELRELLGY